MARQNRWKTFADAFDATYRVGNQLQKAVATGGIALKDYEDEDGKKLKGLALDRARNADYAAAETRFGDPSKGIKMRQDFETSQQNRLMTDLRDATQADRIKQEGPIKTSTMLSQNRYRDSTSANNELAFQIRDKNKVQEATALRAGYGLATARDNLAAEFAASEAARDAGYAELGARAAKGLAEQSEFDAKNIYNSSDTYAQVLKNEGRAKVANAKLDAVTANLQTEIKSQPGYKSNAMAAALSEMKRTASVAMINENLASMPEFEQKLKDELMTGANLAKAALADSKTAVNLSGSADYQANVLQAGLSNSEAAAATAQDQALLAQRSFAANQFISKWYEGADAKNPASMSGLVEGLKQIDPVMANRLARDFGEHELWQITNDALVFRGKANNAMTEEGYDGLIQVLDEYNGDSLGIKMVEGTDGGMSIVETDAEGNTVRTIASGKDEKSFKADLQAGLDPASSLEYLVTLNDMKYKEALALYNTAQAESLKNGKPLSPEQNAYQMLYNPEASLYDKELSLALLLKDNPEAYERLAPLLEVSSTQLTDPNAPASDAPAPDANQGPSPNGLGGDQNTPVIPDGDLQMSDADANTGQVVIDAVANKSVSEVLAEDGSAALLLNRPGLLDKAIKLLQIQITNPKPKPGSRARNNNAIAERQKKLLAELQAQRATLGD